MNQPSNEEIKRHAQVIEQFLADPIVDGAISRLERRYYEEFKKSTTAEERVRSWAKANVWDDFVRELKQITDAGTIVKHMEERSEQRREQR
jgi:hypothetical protein